MAVAPKGLGRGLGALFPDDAQTAKDKQANLALPIASISPNPNQPRREFDQEALQGLADSIKSQGVLQPILVRPLDGSRPPRYEIVAGERRWRASQLAGLVEVPVLIRELSDQDTLAIALIENLQREDLNALEEALGISELKEQFGLSQDELAKTLGKSRSAIANILRLLNLSPAAQAALQKGAISAGHARALLAIADAYEQQALLDNIISANLTVREAEGWAATQKANAGAAAFAAQNIAIGGAGSEGAAGFASDLADASVTSAGLAGAEVSTVGGANLAVGGNNAVGGELPSDLLSEDTPSGAAHGATLVTLIKPKKLPQSAILLDLQNRLAECINMPVRLIGKEEKGKISISYSSREELAALLQKIGLGMEL